MHYDARSRRRETILQFLSKVWPVDGLTNKPARADDFLTYV
jgi:hypothetical protein